MESRLKGSIILLLKSFIFPINILQIIKPILFNK